MAYFSATAVSYATLLVSPELNTLFVQNTLKTVVLLAASFSTVLVLIQILKLKELCEWCLSTAVFSVLIALLVIL